MSPSESETEFRSATGENLPSPFANGHRLIENKPDFHSWITTNGPGRGHTHLVIAAVSIAPIGTESTSVSTYVAETQRVLERYPELTFRLDPMFTTIEGELSQIFSAVQEMHEALIGMGAQRLSTVVKIDDRRDQSHSMEDKIAVVDAKLR